ncbi:MAG TPA: transposase [Acidobacteriota bacterium]|jgi:REP element-mobilizing transposase RayT|nr:transposase [Acidobacteriota bacterium]
MARPLRLEFVGALHHVTSRGNERGTVFLDDTDRDLFLEMLSSVVEKYKWTCHAYCLMDNHYHLLIETPFANLAVGMRQLNGVFTQKYNKKHERTGHLFEGRYKAILVEKESHLLQTARYIVLNPVRAYIVGDPADWKWSSFNATVGATRKPDLLSVDWLLGRFGQRRDISATRYADFVRKGVKTESIWKDLKGQSVLGNEGFADGFKDFLNGRRDLTDIPKVQRFLDRPALGELCGGIDLKNKELRNRVIRRAVIDYGYSQVEVAGFLKLHQTTVSKILLPRRQNS